jgi:predicted lipase
MEHFYMVVFVNIAAVIVAAIGTVTALKVHINYITKAVEKNEKSVSRAHARLNEQELRCSSRHQNIR